MKKRSPKEKAWMKMTIEESIIASLKRRVRPDDLEDKQWLQFKSQVRKGDEIWYYKSPMETWTEWFPRCGREGYALVRDDKVIDEILLAIS
jgi:hypothetical protein